MNFEAGDYVKSGNKWAEVVDIDEENNLEVYFIIQTGECNGKIYKYAVDWEVVTKNTVTQHIKKPKTHSDILQVLANVGFKPMGEVDGEEIFIKIDTDIETDEDLKTYQFPTENADSDDEEESDFDSLDGFIVRDEDGEAFCPADPDSDFVQEVHEAVHDYNKWEPDGKNKTEVGVKRFIDNLEEKYMRKEDDRQFASGLSVNYRHPPLKKQKSKE